jgi:tRNA A37 threonylcarbamoyladenosine synthetase subunit TsaC/SUA5/YrdC
MSNQIFIEQSYCTIKNGGLSLVKADIGYGLLGNSEESIKRMYHIKGRPYSNPCIIAGDLAVLQDVSVLSKPMFEWVRSISALTTLAIVCPINPASTLLPKLSPWLYQQATLEGTIAVFLNSGDYISEIIKKAYVDQLLLIGSSGNLSRQGNNYKFSDVPAEIISQVDYHYDAGSCKYANKEKLATTIVNLAKHNIRRKGVNSYLIIDSYQQYAKRQHLPLLEGQL